MVRIGLLLMSVGLTTRRRSKGGQSFSQQSVQLPLPKRMHRSTSAERMSPGSFEARSVSVMSGNCAVKLASLGISQNDNKAGTQLIDSAPELVGRFIRAVAAAMPSKAFDTAGSNSAPCEVSFNRCPARSNSSTLSDASNALIW